MEPLHLFILNTSEIGIWYGIDTVDQLLLKYIAQDLFSNVSVGYICYVVFIRMCTNSNVTLQRHQCEISLLFFIQLFSAEEKVTLLKTIP